VESQLAQRIHALQDHGRSLLELCTRLACVIRVGGGVDASTVYEFFV